MANKDYLKDFVPNVISQTIRKHPETGEFVLKTRATTRREYELCEKLNEIKAGVLEIFWQERTTNRMLTDIEKDVAALAVKVKRYLEGAK